MERATQLIDRLQEYTGVVYKDDPRLRDLIKELSNTIKE